MQIIKAGYEIVDSLNGAEILKKIEKVARVCYKSEDLIGEGTAEKMVRALIKRNHLAMLEHFSFSVKFIVDRGVSHEIVRHRVASFAQESTRYCNYGTKGGEITVIEPFYLMADGVKVSTDNWSERYGAWVSACGVTGKPHPQMLEVAVPLLKEIKELIPVVFDDLELMEV